MISLVATIKVKEGEEDAFVVVAKELVAKVNENEPGCLYYDLYQGDNPQTFVMIERYENEAALENHRNTDHFKEVGGRMGPLLAGRPEVARYERVE